MIYCRTMSLQSFVLILAVGMSNARPQIDSRLAVLESLAMSPDMYAQYGAEWSGLCRTGNLQSPIEIDYLTASYVPSALPIVFINYNLAKFKTEITTTTIRLMPSIQPNLQLGIASSGFRGVYKLDSAHFHWSAEHVINHQRGALELHMVHYQSTYSSLAEAKNHPNALAVLAVIYNIGPEDPGIRKLMYAVDLKQESSLTAQELLPDDTLHYFRYSGSLTTPACEETVLWTVFQTKRTVSREQVEWFKNIPLADGKPLKSNYRAVQKTNNRVIYNAVATHV